MAGAGHGLLATTRDQQCAYYVAEVKHILPNPCRVLAFDLDHTLIVPKSGRKLPVSHDDWMWTPLVGLTAADREKFRAKCEGYNVVIFSNQAGLKTPEDVAGFMKVKAMKIVQELLAMGVGASIFIALGHSRYRKPKTAMWDLYRHATGIGARTGGVYVGDAAGRLCDFSDCDRKMAANMFFQFETPESWGALPSTQCPPLPPLKKSPHALAAEAGVHPAERYEPFQFRPPGELEVVLLCGSPGSGKSSWTRRAPSHYESVCQDDTRTKASCLSGVESALKRGLAVVVDNTNRDRKTRGEYLARIGKTARALGVNIPVRCVLLRTSKDLTFHLDAMRLDHPIPSESKHKRLPAVAIHTFFKRYEPPSKDEGFAEVYVQPFVFNPDVTPAAHFGKWHVESK